MILILSSDDDVHARHVMQHIAERGHTATLLNLADFPKDAHLIFEAGQSSSRRLMQYRGRTIDLSTVSSVWWRRPQPYGMHPDVTDPVLDHFAIREVDEAIQGLWLSLDAKWINVPSRDQDASRKAWQLDVARSVGLTVPRTLITTDPDAARAFIDREGVDRTIYKPFQGSEDAWRETRLLKAEELDKIDAVKYAPVIFQEYIEATCDLRVTVVGDQIFAAAIDSQKAAYRVDFRMDMNVAITPTRLAPETEAGIRTLMQALDLTYGAIDFRRRSNGEEVFLEINPAGQWLFVEDQTRQPISKAVADCLIERADTKRVPTRTHPLMNRIMRPPAAQVRSDQTVAAR
jgi:hypothetical protein